MAVWTLSFLVFHQLTHGTFGRVMPPEPLDIKAWSGKRVMVITAHPDDAEGFAGGVIASLQQQGDVEVAYLVATSGNAGGVCYNDTARFQCDPSTDREQLALLRRQEMIAAGKFLGVEKVWRLGLDDGMTISYHETRIRRAMAAYIRKFKPHIILTHFPNPVFDASPTCNGACTDNNKRWDDLGFHPDHKHIGTMVFNTVYGAGSAADNDHLFHDLSVAGLEQWQPEQLYFFAITKSMTITHYHPLSQSILEKKVEAQALHVSQYETPPLNFTQWVAEQVANEISVGGMKMAEGYLAFF